MGEDVKTTKKKKKNRTYGEEAEVYRSVKTALQCHNHIFNIKQPQISVASLMKSYNSDPPNPSRNKVSLPLKLQLLENQDVLLTAASDRHDKFHIRHN